MSQRLLITAIALGLVLLAVGGWLVVVQGGLRCGLRRPQQVGVAVADVTGVSGGDHRIRSFVFVTPAHGEQVLTTINCLWPNDLAAPKRAEIDTILSSVHIQS